MVTFTRSYRLSEMVFAAVDYLADRDRVAREHLGDATEFPLALARPGAAQEGEGGDHRLDRLQRRRAGYGAVGGTSPCL
jgi:hypothetical protein